jgi:aminopeptidase-like protein
VTAGSTGEPEPACLSAGIDWDLVPPRAELAAEAERLLRQLYPICRSLTGDGVRATLDGVAAQMPLEVREVPAGTPVFDWTVPPEWHIRDAWIADTTGRRVVDFQRSNLHVLGYSAPVRARLSLEELRPHLFTDPRNPEWVPFRTSYYTRTWGFCLSAHELAALGDGPYDVCIDAWHDDAGSLTYGECRLQGARDSEILLSTYTCHPSLANDNLSGIVLVALLGRYLSRMRLSHTYRLLLSPATIGPLTWLAANEGTLHRVVAGWPSPVSGTPGRSRTSAAAAGSATSIVPSKTCCAGRDRSTASWTGFPGAATSASSARPASTCPWGPSRGPRPTATPRTTAPADDLDLVRPAALADSMMTVMAALDVLETDGRYVNLNPKGEPQLGRRGLYRSIAGEASREMALLWVLNLSDGAHSLLDISDRSGLPFTAVREAAGALVERDLLAAAPAGGAATALIYRPRSSVQCCRVVQS